MKRAEVVVQWSETVNNQALVYTTVPDDLDVNDSEALWEHFNEMLEDDWFQLIEDKDVLPLDVEHRELLSVEPFKGGKA